jgi:hypothetical protein
MKTWTANLIAWQRSAGLSIIRALKPLTKRVPSLQNWIEAHAQSDMPALGVSVVVHVALLLIFAIIGHAASHFEPPAFRSEVAKYELSDFASLDQTSLAEIEETGITPVGGSFAPVTSAFLSDIYAVGGSAPVAAANPTPVKVAPELKSSSIEVAGIRLPKPTKLDANVMIRGNGAEHVDNVEGAVDRVAIEILRKLESGRTLVVWAFDASGSLYAERQRLATYIEKVYEHINALDKSELSRDSGLLTTIVAFGSGRRVLLDAPTYDRAEIAKSIKSVPLDKSGFESSFRTVGEIAQKFGHYSRDGNAYQTMVVMVTDEVGDDDELLEPAISAANQAKMSVFVLGSSALFGRVEGFMDYDDPETKQHYNGLPVKQGPESAALEGIRLPFWYDGPQYDLLDAGFGPFALSRLARATGGIYFITRLGGHRITFDPDGMREYTPDWTSREQYLAILQKSPLRRAVTRAAKICQQNLPDMPAMNFPAFEDPNFKEILTQNQAKVSRILYTVDEALGVTGAAPNEPTMMNVARLRDRETSRRWQAHYDLLRGRLMAIKIRCTEYNYACARIKRDAPKFVNAQSNTWRMVPDTEIHLPDKDAKAAAEATTLLENVLHDHAGTPWALLAQRELKDPLGLKWIETHVPPPPKPREGDGGNPPPRMERQRPQGKPPEVPKL